MLELQNLYFGALLFSLELRNLRELLKRGKISNILINIQTLIVKEC